MEQGWHNADRSHATPSNLQGSVQRYWNGTEWTDWRERPLPFADRHPRLFVAGIVLGGVLLLIAMLMPWSSGDSGGSSREPSRPPVYDRMACEDEALARMRSEGVGFLERVERAARECP